MTDSGRYRADDVARRTFSDTHETLDRVLKKVPLSPREKALVALAMRFGYAAGRYGTLATVRGLSSDARNAYESMLHHIEAKSAPSQTPSPPCTDAPSCSVCGYHSTVRHGGTFRCVNCGYRTEQET